MSVPRRWNVSLVLALIILMMSILGQYGLYAYSDSGGSVVVFSMGYWEAISLSIWVVLMASWFLGALALVHRIALTNGGVLSIERWAVALSMVSTLFSLASGLVGMRSILHPILQTLWVATATLTAWRAYNLTWKSALGVLVAVAVYFLVTLGTAYAVLRGLAPVDGGLGG